MKSQLRRAKIVATLGPASSDPDTIRELIKAGVNVFRLNFSHGKKQDHLERIRNIRKISQRLGISVAILQDLQGPKLRVGRFSGGSLELRKGDSVAFVLEKRETIAKPKGHMKLIPYNYKDLAGEIGKGHRIFLDDGNLEIVVTAVENEVIQGQVVFGGILKDHKGMNFPDTQISIESFTKKDREDLLFGMEQGVDYVALSFVRSAYDVRTVQRFMLLRRKNIPVVAKIEKAEAITNLQEILDVSAAVMVARGDLAVEVGTAQVPVLQKQIIRQCMERGIPVITATQMLESMISTPRPTRAEASDVANAVLDGTDALMLSAESASGKYPVLSVSVMHGIILETESKKQELERIGATVHASRRQNPRTVSSVVVDGLENAAAQLAQWIEAQAIACTTHSGRSALSLARYRPQVPILALTDDPVVERKLALVWGVMTARIAPVRGDLDKLVKITIRELVQRLDLERGDQVVFTAGWPPLQQGSTSLVQVIKIR